MHDELNRLRAITPEALLALGTPNVAYMHPVKTEEGLDAVGIFGADGEPIGIVANRDQALAAMWQHGLEPVSLH